MMENKKVIRLTESDLRRIVKESAQKIIQETNDENPSKSFDEVYQMIIDCNDAIRSFIINTYTFKDSNDVRLCKRILSIADSLHEAAHEFQEHLAWD